jgi:photosystem II stability/assembly factor-like uncharacterized protein
MNILTPLLLSKAAGFYLRGAKFMKKNPGFTASHIHYLNSHKTENMSLMKKSLLIPALLLLLGIIAPAHAQVPQLINYQGRVAVNGTNFDGSGQFKFALVNTGGTTTYWSNDGTGTGGNAPTNAVSLTVTKGLYSVLLGDATLTNMTAVPLSVFNNSDVRLRVWFNDGSTGWQQLTPDQRIAAVGYAMVAGSVPDGSITTAKIASGAVGSIQIASGAIGSSQLASGAFPVPQNVAGTSQAVTPNTSYAVTGNSTATFSLPSSANVGDAVQISGAGAGWVASLPNWNWTARESIRNWNGIASSSDGTKLAAVVRGGQIYTSTDSGVTWTARASSQNWYSIASSSDGTKLVAVDYGGKIYTSTDSGVTWTPRASNQNWWTIASSSDGTKLVAVVYNGQIYTSTDSGVTWTARATSQYWTCIASSSNGTKLAAVGWPSQIYTSSDSGATWTARATSQNWNGIASSSDGTKLVAGVYGGQIYTSTDSGVTWTARAPSQQWTGMASSSDGTKLAATAATAGVGQIYTSIDSGATWTAVTSSQNWFGIASSLDATKLAAVVYGGQIYTGSQLISGSQGTMSTFQYVGNGQWVRMIQAP